MFATLFTAALAASSVAAAPVLQERKEAPSHWAHNYLEDYLTYHTRYIALDCQRKHDTDFFNDCCRPMLASENLDEHRKDYCRPSEEALASASTRVAAKATKTGDAAPQQSAASENKVEDADQAAEAFTTAAAAASSAAPEPESEAPKPAPTQEATSTEEKKPEPTSGGGQSFHGQATHFTPWDGTGVSFSAEPQLGHCGKKWGDYGGLSGKWVALKSSLYGDGEHCGKQVRITTKDGKSSVGTVLDSCPSCHTDGHIDISPSMFNDLQDIVSIPFDNDEQPSNDPGILEVDWQFI